MRQNITVVRGDDAVRALPLPLSVSPLDITDAWLTVGSLFEKRLGAGLEIDSDELSLTVVPADTDGAPAVRVAYPFDAQVQTDDGIQTVVRGLFIVLPDVTTRTD